MKLHATVKANQRDDRLWWDGTGLVAHIKEMPQEGKANRYLEKLIAATFGVSPSRVAVVKGHTSSHKTIDILAPEADVSAALTKLPKLPRQDSLL